MGFFRVPMAQMINKMLFTRHSKTLLFCLMLAELEFELTVPVAELSTKPIQLVKNVF